MWARAAGVTVLMALSCVVVAQEAEGGCSDASTYALLDFWVGEWTVYSGGEKVGENRIEKVLGGCAVAEFWKGVAGGRGQSLFYVDTEGHWKQVWVTERAAAPGGVKEKSHLPDSAGRFVRFQGEISHPRLGRYLDRTTLTPSEDGTVRQHIEISMDGGTTWDTTFDAIYRPAGEIWP